MFFRVRLALALVLWLSLACSPAPIPTSIPETTRAPSPIASPTIELHIPTILLPKSASNHYAPMDVPACQGIQPLDEPIKFGWDSAKYAFANMPENQWTFYRCAQARPELTTFYRQQMTAPHLNWLEIDHEERADATLLVYNNSPTSVTRGYRWVFLWILPEKSNPPSSYLIAAWYDAYYH